MRAVLTLLNISVFLSCTSIDVNERTAIGLRQYKHDSLAQSIVTLSGVISMNDTCRRCLLYRGFAYKGLGKYDEALEDFNTLIKIDNSQSIAYANRASVHYLKNDYKSALKDFTAAYHLDSSDIYLNPICHMLFANGYKDSACVYYQKSLKLGDSTFDKSIKTYCDYK